MVVDVRRGLNGGWCKKRTYWCKEGENLMMYGKKWLGDVRKEKTW